MVRTPGSLRKGAVRPTRQAARARYARSSASR